VVLKNAGHRDNILLQPGDSMAVPECNPGHQFRFFGTSPRPGLRSVTSVPGKQEAKPPSPTQLLGSIAQILASTVAIVVVTTR